MIPTIQVYDGPFASLRIKGSVTHYEKQSLLAWIIRREPLTIIDRIQTLDGRWWSQGELDYEIERLYSKGVTDIQEAFGEVQT